MILAIVKNGRTPTPPPRRVGTVATNGRTIAEAAQDLAVVEQPQVDLQTARVTSCYSGLNFRQTKRKTSLFRR